MIQLGGSILRAIAGLFAGAGALILINQGETAVGASLLAVMLGFFIGEANGRKQSGTA